MALKRTRLESKNKDTKEEIMSKAGEVKESVAEKGEGVKIKASEAKDSVSDKGKELKESASEKGEEIRSTAEKIVNDVLKTLREKQEDLGKTINEYTAPTTPYVDIIDTPVEFIIMADLPGVEKENLSVDVTNESVTITATFPDGIDVEDANYIKRERGFGEVSRTLQLTDEIKIKEASANFEEGILTIKLPKKIAESKKLEIK
ncbi:MAG: Hsp20 family protein [Methanobacteriaceae archaeon]|nr:Hsp20 family protein [Methanobacteriaceae archaeon]